MRAYAVEGLDCSGKKTVARLVRDQLLRSGIDAAIVIGPLAGGRLRRLDGALANITVPVPRGSATDRLRRALYVAEPVIDGLACRGGSAPVLKVSTHFRAWARAEMEDDRWMARAYALTAPAQVRFAGAALLSADFGVRLRRHAADAAAGRTAKVASRRFLGPDPDAFAAWHRTLDALMSARIPCLLRLDTSRAEPDQLAGLIARHAIACWGRAGISAPEPA
ncbi:MAG TPA: hypothetical protein VMV92_28585 [Streptosporangiaceae bacterium]|nr:hypothetical protein [Streptosporangiaceae bacterium]HVB46117.1 hypothetical protein [Streptosporangiaceae bacterium]